MRGAVWILVPILAAGCAGGSGERQAKREALERAADASTVPKTAPRTEPQVSRGASGGAATTARPAPKPKRKGGKTKPRHRSVSLPWRDDGISQVVHVRVRRVAVYTSPQAKRPMLILRKRDERGTQRAFLVRSLSQKWVRVYLPTRPNGSVGWVRRRAVHTYTNGYRLVVRLRSHKLHLWRGGRLLATYPVAVGTRSTPTPRGLFYVVELLKPHRPDGTYGPYSFGLSAHSTVLKRFAGGDGRVGLHGTNQPDLIGTDVSHGCIRVRNAAIRHLAGILPLGTPVYIRS